MPCVEVVFEKYKKNRCDMQRKAAECGWVKSDAMTIVI
jgi:hypothetical protein